MRSVVVFVATTVTLALLVSSDSGHDGRPFFIGCRSPEQETFSCWWDPGLYGNVSGTPAFKVLYSQSGCQELKECPDYVTSGENSCYFNQLYTSVWTGYCLLIEVKTEWGSVTSEPYSIDILNILQPDPPVLLNWARLNATDSTHYADVIIKWAPPPSADVSSGWISLQYQLRFRSTSNQKWKMGPVILQRSSALYALEIGQEYEVQVRCKPQSEGNFSTFSDSLCFSLSPQRRPLSVLPGFISLASTVLPPLAVFLSLFVLYVLCSGTRIKHVLLPPIPVPKITGINMELLWGGQPSDLGITYNSIKCSPEMSEENWEEFPETDFQDDTTSHMLESGKGPQAGNCADGSDSGCESMDSSDIDYSRDSLPVSYNSLETISSEMAPSPGLDEDGNIRSFAKPQRDPLKLLAAFCTFAEGQEDDRMPQYRKAQVGQVLFKYNDSGGFYSHVKPLASESGVIAQADGGIVPPTATTVNQGHWQMLSKHLRGTAPESASSPEHTDANYYVIL